MFMFAFAYLFVSLVKQTSGGCSGYKDLPLQLSKPSSKVITGNKNYARTNVKTLAQLLSKDIRGLTLKYTLEIAENAIEAEEDAEHTFTFCLTSNKATLTQYEINTKNKGKTLTISWRIAEAAVKFKAIREFTVHARRRRRWIGGGRRRCAKSKQPRGVTKVEVIKIRNTLNAVSPSRRRSMFKSRRYKQRNLGSERQCPSTISKRVRPPINACGGRGNRGRRRNMQDCR